MTTRRRPPPSPRVLVPLVVAVVQALVILGPALGRGVVIRADMPWSPDPRWTPFVLGLDTPAPRVVPSDAVAVLLGKIVGASLAQHLVLLSILVALALGVVALVDELDPGVGVAGLTVAAVAAVWNPFVSERLAVGQWVVVLGLAVLPWGLRAALRVLRGQSSGYAVALALVAASVGGVNALLLVGGAVLVVLVTGAVAARSWRVARAAGAALLVSLGGAAAWAVPAVTAPATADEVGARLFAPVADSPVGVVGSLLGGGGFWNTGTHPEARGQLVIALTAAVLSVLGVGTVLLTTGRSRRWSLVSVLVVFGVLVAASVSPTTEGLWADVVTGLPGGGALRDSQKLIAPWVVLAATGLGLLTDRLAERLPVGLVAPAVALLVGMPVVLSLQLAWGVGGRLDAVTVPADLRSGVDTLNALPDGVVGLLPWSQYRRYGWNDDRVSLTLAPRMMDRVVLYDDSLPLSSGVVRGESERAAAVSARIAGGESPETAVAGAEVRYVAAELGAGQRVDTDRLRTLGTVVVDEEHLLVVDLGGQSGRVSGPAASALGWAVTLLTWTGVIGWHAVRKVRRKLPAGLLRSRP